MWTILLFVATASAGLNIQLPGHCSLPLDRGRECGGNSTIRYYMDKDRLQCFPFRYNGCGGNGNNFESESACFNCLPADLNFCPGNTDPVKDAKGESYCNHQKKCAEGAKCRMGFAVGLCCSNDSIKRENADNEPACPKGKEAYKAPRFGFDSLFTGLKCSSCHQGEFISYCCK
ncbi:unnamed protein product, partial [Mesorhabditis spiculigera]